ncbi:MAG: transcriptional repressor [Planctomycetota bacterium]
MSRTPELTLALQNEIRAAGIRATPARVATLALLRDASSPLTHADVAAKLVDEDIDKATAFRNLNDMTDAGLLRRTELGDRLYRFEKVLPGEIAADSHPHFVCIECGSVYCMHNINLTAGSLGEAGKVGEVSEILLRGLCNTCKENQPQ